MSEGRSPAEKCPVCERYMPLVAWELRKAEAWFKVFRCVADDHLSDVRIRMGRRGHAESEPADVPVS
jgi:hypothetical protein